MINPLISHFLVPILTIVFWIYPSIVKASYQVTVEDKNLTFSPKLFGRSTVVYNDTMYVYGGQTSLGIAYSNDMYAYEFDVISDKVKMTKVKQVNKGPLCTFCGAVMIDEKRMMILTHDFNKQIPDVVKPFIFDFETREWTSNVDPPTYNEAHQSYFQMRKKHSTVLDSNGNVYTIGGVNFFYDETPQMFSWYFDQKNNSYGIVQDNNTETYMVISPNAFNLP